MTSEKKLFYRCTIDDFEYGMMTKEQLLVELKHNIEAFGDGDCTTMIVVPVEMTQEEFDKLPEVEV